MSMFTAHRKYQRPSEVELTVSERVDFDFIVTCERTIDPDFMPSPDDVPWKDQRLIERYLTYMERWDFFRHKHMGEHLPPAVREYAQFEYGYKPDEESQ